MAADPVGEASILIRASDTGFAGDVKAKAEAATKSTNVKIPTSLDESGIAGSASRIESTLTNLASHGSAKLQSFAGSSNVVTKGLKEIEGAGLSTASILTGVVAGGVIAVGAAFSKMASDGIQAFVSQTAEVRKLKAATGETAQEASVLRNQITALGLDTDTVSKAYGILSKNIEHNTGKFAEYGVQIARNAQGQVDLAGTVQNIGDAYKSANTAQERNAMILDLLGRGGAALRPILAATREELDKWGRLGQIYNDQDLQKGKDFQIATRELGIAFKSLEIDVGKGLIPALTSLANTMTDLTERFDRGWHKVGDFLDKARENSVVKFLGEAARALSGDMYGMGDNMDKAKHSTESLAHEQARLETELSQAAESAKAEQEALDAMATAQEKSIDLTLGLTGAHHQAAEAALNVEQAESKYNEAVKQNGINSIEARDAQLALEGAHQSQTGALVDLAKAMADAEANQRGQTGETITASIHAEIYRGKLLEVAGTVEGPLRGQLEALANRISTLPDHTSTITVDTSQAYQAVAALEGRISSANFNIAAIATAAANQPRQHGGPVVPGGSYTVGEAGMERLDMGPGGYGWVTPLNTSSTTTTNNTPVSVTMTNHFAPGTTSDTINYATRQLRSEMASIFEHILSRRSNGTGRRLGG